MPAHIDQIWDEVIPILDEWFEREVRIQSFTLTSKDKYNDQEKVVDKDVTRMVQVDQQPESEVIDAAGSTETAQATVYTDRSDLDVLFDGTVNRPKPSEVYDSVTGEWYRVSTIDVWSDGGVRVGLDRLPPSRGDKGNG